MHYCLYGVLYAGSIASVYHSDENKTAEVSDYGYGIGYNAYGREINEYQIVFIFPTLDVIIKLFTNK